MGVGEVMGENTGKEDRKQIHLKLSTPSISIAISLIQRIIIVFSVDLAVAFLLVSQSPRLPAYNP